MRATRFAEIFGSVGFGAPVFGDYALADLATAVVNRLLMRRQRAG